MWRCGYNLQQDTGAYFSGEGSFRICSGAATIQSGVYHIFFSNGAKKCHSGTGLRVEILKLLYMYFFRVAFHNWNTKDRVFINTPRSLHNYY